MKRLVRLLKIFLVFRKYKKHYVSTLEWQISSVGSNRRRLLDIQEQLKTSEAQLADTKKENLKVVAAYEIMKKKYDP